MKRAVWLLVGLLLVSSPAWGAVTVGANKITSWQNRADCLGFDTFTSSGANITLDNETATGTCGTETVGYARTNLLGLTKGATYVLTVADTKASGSFSYVYTSSNWDPDGSLTATALAASKTVNITAGDNDKYLVVRNLTTCDEATTFTLYKQLTDNTVTVTPHGDDAQGWRTLTYEWVGSATTGAVTATALTADLLAYVKGWLLCGAETDPSDNSTIQPTTLYDITLVDGSTDIMGGSLANRSASATEYAVPKLTGAAGDYLYGCRPIWNSFTYTTANQSVNRATGVTRLYFFKPSN